MIEYFMGSLHIIFMKFHAQMGGVGGGVGGGGSRPPWKITKI